VSDTREPSSLSDAPARVRALFEHTARAHPRSARNLYEARDAHPARFDALTDELLASCERVLGDRALEVTVGGFVRFSNGVAFDQARYERDGAYAHKRYEEVNAALYSQTEEMSDYLWGCALTNVLWVHHLELSLFYIDRFLGRAAREAAGAAAPVVVELAPGHGWWGRLALRRLPRATLRAFDISPASMLIARALADADGLGARASYAQMDATRAVEGEGAVADLCVCNFLVEHLERPADLLASIAHLLKPGGWAFFSGVLTAAQVDHIYEFRRESELVALAEGAGLRAVETMSLGPERVLKGARLLPRSMSLILHKRPSGAAWGEGGR